MGRSPFEAVLFDMDGVIINTEKAVTAFWEELAAQERVTLTPEDYTRHVYGCSARHTFETLFPMLNSSQQQAILDRMVRYEVEQQAYTPVAGAIPLLRALKTHHVPTALVTSGAMWKVKAVEGQLGLAGMFTIHVTSDDITRSKPHPEGYLTAARRLGRAPERCIVFEDALSGVEAARAAGTTCVGIGQPDGSSHLRGAGAICVIPDLDSARLSAEPSGLLLHLDGSAALPLIGSVP
jgi:HAD superfamily hydrolase (TIGR01509 family)